MKLIVWTQVVDETDPMLGFFHGWLLALAANCTRVDVVCFRSGAHRLPAHVHIHTLGKGEGRSKIGQLMQFYRHFYRALRQQPDVVLFHMGAVMNLLAAPFYFWGKIKRRRPTYFWWKAHGHINWVGRLALHTVDRVYCSTASGFPINTPKRRIIGQAIDTTQFTCQSRDTTTTILYIGRISPIKSLETIIDTVLLLDAAPPPVSCRIIGPVTDESYAQALQASVTDQAVAAITFVSPLAPTALLDEYCQAEFFINPSQTHSMDKTVLEAMACGVIPLTTNRAFKELLEPYNLYHEENDPAWYASRLRELQATDTTELRRTLRQLVIDGHSLDTLATRIFSTYNTKDVSK